MKKVYVHILSFLILISSVNCVDARKNLPLTLRPKGTISNTSFNNKEYLNKWNEWVRDSEEKLKVFKDRPKEDLEKELGSPNGIQRDVILQKKHYDELWRYDYSRGIPFVSDSSWAYFFYINKGVVEYIEVF